MAAKIKKGDKVVLIAGASKGTVGTVQRVLPERDQVVVEGVRGVKRHLKPSARNPEGGIVEKNLPVHVSNVALLDPETNKPTRVRMQTGSDGKKVRVAKSGKVIETPKPAPESAS